MKISEQQLQTVLTPNVKYMSEIFNKHGHEIRFAGGPVRDLLMNKIPTDLDFATTATPTEMKKMFEEENIRMINLGGEKHGTITAHVNEENFECTTLRIDKVTDGRRAEVEFIKNWELDAGRRDLTINAMFMGFDGTVYDFFNGIEHLKERKILFVGNPEQRLQEDYLRILRYFRFYGRIALHPDSHDKEVIASIEQNCAGLNMVSGERIWVELKKIVCNRFGGNMVTKLIDCGVGPFIGLPDSYDCDRLLRLYINIDEHFRPQDFLAITLLSSGFHSEKEADIFIQRIKCSNKEKDTLAFVLQHRDSIQEATEFLLIGLMTDMVYLHKKPKDIAMFCMQELLKCTSQAHLLDQLENISIPTFPIKGGLLVNIAHKRKHISHLVKLLYFQWKESHYTLTREQLLDIAVKFAEDLNK